MKTKVSVLLAGFLFVLLMFLTTGCAQKVNNPADVQAIKTSVDDYVKAMNAMDANAAVAMMGDNMVYADLNLPAVAGKEAIRKMHQDLFALFGMEFTAPVVEVRVAGDLGAARGSWTFKLTPKSELVAQSRDRGSWSGIFQRQSDGTWKWESVVVNSDQPLPGTTTDGGEENALLQIEQDWMNGLVKSDLASFERFVAKEWTCNSDGQVMSRAQTLADLKSGAYKFESAKMSDFSAHVFGDAAMVMTTATMKGKYKGIDMPSPQRSIDFFVKRDGRWQAISTQNFTIKP
jgi:uncharacterized protein (TIGR02246 family)